ncbi:MAG TPA: 6-carboxytetrahydropterin synthase QueD [Kiritimatiellia bacterium]|jgi:6-pyruvoyltetrahydropterin/6-carboxytetrahydropterin synthase|nr:6-carboxytetrahydropterin synthase QueD [Kiritimatiellia bacterium]HOM58955.1 6-carboxytetrahydropterin synthase QueD [Kiritimatiellia bacterium]HOR96967.1 6-carboxytetrahydropterin synthase QueD [Kiritimatiellia bacterium]HPW74800.1 6-carboxytetrahydropterin synthase QueD [Kiritimatiellia bacterium]HRU19226.1 6-carboxytetrahydropterin synthase QueD [Kiritimatiellia bacterium]
MLTVSKQCQFDAAHVLPHHAGQCKNLHGHTYRVIVEVAEDADSEDMVIDFKDLKQVIRDVIVDRFDHAFLYDETSESECEIAAVIAKHGMRSVGLPFRSTAENLARYFFHELATRVNVVSVKVYETPESCAEYRRG